jgi:AcrR family transcriptional regulator
MFNMNDTRDRILQTALDLFIEQGYDKTSLREIAERVGVTKAALYYHFESKEAIFRTLVEPWIAVQARAMELLESHPSLEAWSKGLAAMVEWVLPQRRMFELFENNQSTLQALAQKMTQDSGYVDAHRAAHERVDGVLSDEATPLADRVRMAGAIGLLMGVFGFAAGRAFFDVPSDELQPVLIAAINDVLRVD